MATAAISPSIQECPICIERLRDPRILECAHHFCRVCLEEIAERHPQGHVTCPICRHVTKTTGPKDVSNLHRFRITSTFTESIKQFESASKTEVIGTTKKCGLCDDKRASKFCQQCDMHFCDSCLKGHGEMEEFDSHEMQSLGEQLLCKPHAHKAVAFCKDCASVCCVKCTLDTHKSHDRCKLDDAGKFADKQMDILKSKLDNSQIAEGFIRKITKFEDETNRKAQNTNTEINELEKELEEFLSFVRKTRMEINVKYEIELKSLAMMKDELTDFVQSKVTLQRKIRHLQQNGSLTEKIAGLNNLPDYSPETDWQMVEGFSVQNPKLDISLKDIAETIKELGKKIKMSCETIKFQSDIITAEPIKAVRLLKTFTSKIKGRYVYGITADETQKELVVCCHDQQEPITIFDYNGNKKRTLGARIAGIADQSYKSLDIDTKRGLYVLPVAGDIMLIDKQGNKTGQLKVTDKNIHGICYDKHKDVYITSSHGDFGGDNKVYIINAADRTVLSSFLSVTSFGVASGYQTVNGQTKHVIAVTGQNTHCVKVYDFQGNVLYTVGVEGKAGSTDGHLKSPWGVCIDPSGRILVGGAGQNRIISVDKTEWSVLLNTSTFANYVCYDCLEQRLFVAYERNGGEVSIFSF